MIESIHLKNFKCFESQPIEFTELTILTGINGAGKSSILQALLLLRQSARDFPAATMRRLALNGELVNLGTAKDVLFERALKDEITFEAKFSESASIDWTFTYRDPGATVMVPNREPYDTTSSGERLNYYREGLFSRAFHYLQAERTGPRTYFRVPDYASSRRGQIGTQGQYAVHYLSVYGATQLRNTTLAHPRASSMLLKDQVEAWMDEISPGTRIHITPHSDIDLVSLRYSFAAPRYASSPYRSTNVGFGITYTLPVILCLLASLPSRAMPLVLLENPEAHLHPRGQSKMGELIAKVADSGTQVIVETHSDHILNGIRLAVKRAQIAPQKVTINFLQRSPDESLACRISNPQIDKDGRIDKWPPDFFDEWDKSLENLLETPES